MRARWLVLSTFALLASACGYREAFRHSQLYCLPGETCYEHPHSERATTVLAETEGYRYLAWPNAFARKDTSKLLLALAFSGGGMRAAAFSYGVLQQLDRDTVTRDGQRRTMLDHVDVISSVSGGSFTAAYYGLHGKDGWRTYEEEFLHHEFKGALI